MSKINIAKDSTIHDFKLYYRAIALKQHGISTITTFRSVDRRPRYKLLQLQPSDFDKYTKNSHCRKDSIFKKYC